MMKRKRKSLVSKKIFQFSLIIVGLLASLYAFWTYTTYLSSASSSNLETSDLVVGAIRFDAWFSPPNYGNESNISAPEWRHRLPFYAKIKGDGSVEVRGDSQEIVDQEIQHASANGLDYWAFNYYGIYALKPRDPNSAFGGLHYGLRYYLSSQYRNSLNFALNVTGEWIFNGNEAEKWDQEFVPTVIKLMKEAGYQKVLGDRPLLFIYKMDQAAEKMGGEEQLRNGIERLRRAAQRNGLQDPYIVGLLWGYTHPVDRVMRYGVDAVSAYTAHRGNDYNNGKLWPYTSLARSNEQFWNRLAQEAPAVVPIVNVGWDYRPNLTGEKQSAIDTYVDSPVYEHAKPWEIRLHLVNAIKWLRANAEKTPAKAILIYSWAEYPEGGVLAPTLEEGDARLKAVALALNRNRSQKPPEEIEKPDEGKDEVTQAYMPVAPLYVGIRNANSSLEVSWINEPATQAGFKSFWIAIREAQGNEQVAGGVVNNNKYVVSHAVLQDGEYIVRVQALYDVEEKRIIQTIRIKVAGGKIWVVR